MKPLIGSLFVLAWLAFVGYLSWPAEKIDWTLWQYGSSHGPIDIFLGADCRGNVKSGWRSDRVSDEIYDQIQKLRAICPQCTIEVIP